MKLSDSVRIPVHVLARDLGSEVVILDLASGTYFGLNSVAARAWRFMSDGQTLTKICDRLIEDFQVSREELERDILKLAEDLETNGLIVQAGA